MPFRPAGAIHELLRIGEERLKPIVYVVWAGWLAFVLVACGGLSLLAWALDAPWWAYLLVAALGVALVAPVFVVGLVVLAAVAGWKETAETAARVESAGFSDRGNAR